MDFLLFPHWAATSVVLGSSFVGSSVGSFALGSSALGADPFSIGRFIIVFAAFLFSGTALRPRRFFGSAMSGFRAGTALLTLTAFATSPLSLLTTARLHLLGIPLPSAITTSAAWGCAVACLPVALVACALVAWFLPFVLWGFVVRFLTVIFWLLVAWVLVLAVLVPLLVWVFLAARTLLWVVWTLPAVWVRLIDWIFLLVWALGLAVLEICCPLEISV